MFFYSVNIAYLITIICLSHTRHIPLRRSISSKVVKSMKLKHAPIQCVYKGRPINVITLHYYPCLGNRKLRKIVNVLGQKRFVEFPP